MYAEASGTRFPLYTDPQRALYGALDMQRTLALGSRPQYIKRHLLVSSAVGMVQALRQIPKGLTLSGGDQKQVGGEFLVEGGKVVKWCHRMRNTRDHAEVGVLRGVLGMEG